MSKQPREGTFTKSTNTIREAILANDNLGATAYVVYITLLSFRHEAKDHAMGLCCPSIDTIAEKIHMSKSTVNRAIKALYDEDYLLIDSGKQHVSSRYAFPQEPFYCESDIYPVGGEYGGLPMKPVRKKKAFRKKNVVEAETVHDTTSKSVSPDDEEDDFGF